MTFAQLFDTIFVVEKQIQKLSAKTKVSFALGDVFGGGSFNIINFMYPAYAALTLGLGASLAGIIVLISKIWDAITDPVMGHISDRTQSKMGKRRIYILIASPLVLVGMLLMFFPWTAESTALRFALALLSYMFFSAVQTMVMIPYYSLSSEISADYAERSGANTLRLAFSVFSSIICVAVPNLVVNAIGQPNGYIVMSLCFGTMFMLVLLCTALFAKEQVVTPKSTAKFSFKQFVKPLKNKSFCQYMAMHVCASITMATMSSIFFFYVMYVVKSGNTLANGGAGDGLGTLAAGVMFVMQIFALPFYLKMINKKGKAFTYRFGATWWIVVALLLLALPANMPDSQNWLIFVICGVFGFGVSGAVLVPHTMIGDVNDACQLQFGERIEGAVSGLLNFANKLCQAIGVGLVLNLLELVGGFVNPDPGQLVASQPLSAQTILTLLMALVPLAIMTVGIVVSFKYKITKQKQKEILQFNKKYNQADDKKSLQNESGSRNVSSP